MTDIRDIRPLLALLGMILLGIGPMPGTARAREVPAFYDAAPRELAGKPGSIIRSESLAGTIPPGASGWRILYRSTGLKGESIAVSAIVLVPEGEPPAEGRPVVAWQHPTSGIARGCAPSLSPQAARMVMGLPALLAKGYVVVASDYPGLGTAGQHPYLIGLSEGRATLDPVRAARALPQAHAGKRFVAWGHSQGGHATLYAGLLARDYAPELQLLGLAAAAPATGLSLIAKAPIPDRATDARLFLAMILKAWGANYGLALDPLVPPGAQPYAMALADVCFDPPWESAAQPHDDPPVPQVQYRMTGPLASDPRWAEAAERNTPGPLPAAIPVFIAQGVADTTVPPALTAAYMQALCKGGSAVRMVLKPGVGHRFIARDAAAEAVSWIADRFAGKAAPSDCG